ncbi:hypothetical protein SAMN05421788_10564 [Filimonas lacunae]|uniref:DUF5675 domain-containing protein n=1 Tax=Filimonas lacunae TaxID=477680 RepID=A0A173MD20_9BACT|nr:DUF5675 family protein [Filimonas lacunae]BAV05484.1 hypothetical protein FLA_1491 [Filimonas lacunae]SIT20798.1 hypothetical protein SAMN05421788_10564 [Filimonas lacunae]
MQLILQRTYYANGTNGNLYVDGRLFCYTIELPWLQNKTCVSCIPEGTYRLVKRFSDKFKSHLHVQGVKGRSLILIHPANNALLQLQGCIAPVTTITGPGCGNLSRAAFQPLVLMVYHALDNNKSVLLTITTI